jgi:hypothetical protein
LEDEHDFPRRRNSAHFCKAFVRRSCAAHTFFWLAEFGDMTPCVERGHFPTFGTPEPNGRSGRMDDAAQKLRSLARQSRALSAATRNQQRANALQALARLYEKQAKELELA